MMALECGHDELLTDDVWDDECPICLHDKLAQLRTENDAFRIELQRQQDLTSSQEDFDIIDKLLKGRTDESTTMDSNSSTTTRPALPD